MAIYGWIYANAKRNENLDYCSRGGHKELKEWGLTMNMDSLLPKIASRLISPEYRNYHKNQKPCWFAGYLDKEKYMVAVGGTQEALLGMPIDGGGFRLQLCVFAYIFTEDDICLYKRDIVMFEPLKEKLKVIQCTKAEEENEQLSCLIQKDLSEYKLLPYKELSEDGQLLTKCKKEIDYFNILESTMEMDNTLWLQSLQRPVAVSVSTMKDAEQLLDLFLGKNGVVTIIDGNKKQYQPKQNMVNDKERQNIKDKNELTEDEKIDLCIKKLEEYLSGGNVNSEELQEMQPFIESHEYEKFMTNDNKRIMEKQIKLKKGNIEEEKIDMIRNLCYLLNFKNKGLSPHNIYQIIRSEKINKKEKNYKKWKWSK